MYKVIPGIHHYSEPKTLSALNYFHICEFLVFYAVGAESWATLPSALSET